MSTPAAAASRAGAKAARAAARGAGGLEGKLTATQLASHTRAAVAIHALVLCVLPIVTHVEVFERDKRLVTTAVVFWVTAAVLGGTGFAAIDKGNNMLLCVYVIGCVVTGAGLAVYSLLVDYLLASGCLVGWRTRGD